MSENTTPAICGQAMCGQTICGNVDMLQSISITTPPTKIKYIEGQRFNGSGMVVSAEYRDRNEVITDYIISPSEALRGNINNITISYTKNGVTKTATQDILVIRDCQSDKLLVNKLNRAGTGTPDLYAKNIRFVHEDISLDLLHLPFFVTHIYNAKNTDDIDTYCGAGWRTNLHQRIITPTSSDGDNTAYIYIDGNGDRNKIILSKDKNGNIIKDKDGLNVYEFENDKTFKYNPYIGCIYRGDRISEGILYFDSQKRLQQLVLNKHSRMYIKYVDTYSMRIDSVRDHYIENEATKTVKFNYLNNKKLGSITYSAPLSENIGIYFTYNNNNGGNNLMRINYQSTMSADYTYFTYRADGLLQSVTDPIGHTLEYGYSGGTMTVTEKPGSIVKHPMLKLSENLVAVRSNKVWSVYYADNTRITKDGRSSIIGFDFSGNFSYSFIDQTTGNNPDKLDVTDDLQVHKKRMILKYQLLYLRIYIIMPKTKILKLIFRVGRP